MMMNNWMLSSSNASNAVRRMQDGQNMGMFNIRSLALVTLILGSLAATGCYVEPVGPEPVVAEGYTPQYYDGYVVYYDGVGRPFYYVNGVQVWVPPSSPYYVGYVNYWHAYGPAYNRWYSTYGYRYRGWRGRSYGGRGYYRGGGRVYRGGGRVYRRR
jgi:hypothetical protein